MNGVLTGGQLSWDKNGKVLSEVRITDVAQERFESDNDGHTRVTLNLHGANGLAVLLFRKRNLKTTLLTNKLFLENCCYLR